MFLLELISDSIYVLDISGIDKSKIKEIKTIAPVFQRLSFLPLKKDNPSIPENPLLTLSYLTFVVSSTPNMQRKISLPSMLCFVCGVVLDSSMCILSPFLVFKSVFQKELTSWLQGVHLLTTSSCGYPQYPPQLLSRSHNLSQQPTANN